MKTTIFFGLFTTLPLLASFWIVASTISPRKNEKARYPGRPVEHYLTFKKPADQTKYHGKNKIPMETFYEMYFDGDVEFNGDCLEVLEYRHDWASFRFTLGLIKFVLTGLVPEALMHTRSQGKTSYVSFLLRILEQEALFPGAHWLTALIQTRSRSATTTTEVTISMAGSSALA